jgi:iron complex outermembrane receptor protein
MLRRQALVPLLAGFGLLARTAGAQVESAPDDVEVRAPPLSPAVGVKDPSVAGSTTHRSELEAPGVSAADALKTQVGVSLVETGALGAPATASVRGATAAETPVYVAGVRINDDVAGTADLSTVPVWLMDRVEVYRGNGPLEADRLTLGGAIFFEPLRADRTRAGIAGHAGSYGSRGASAYAGSGSPAHGLLLGVRLEGAENDYSFHDTQGTELDPSDDQSSKLENADVELLDLWLLGSLKLGGGRVDVLAQHFERDQGATSLAQVRTEAARQALTRTLGSVTGHAPLGESATLELRTTALVGRAITDNPGFEPEVLFGVDRLEIDGERVDQAAMLRFQPSPGFALRTGVEAASERLRRYEGVERAGAAPVLDALRLSGRVVAGAELELTRGVWLRPLGSLECHGTEHGTGDACDAFEPTGRLAALATFGEFSVFGGAGRYARVPTLGELYGMSLAVHGNPELESETGFSFDAGARYSHALREQTAPLYVGLSAYFREAQNLVSFVRTNQRYVVPENLEAARVRGLELEAGSGFLRYFDAEAGLTLFDGRDQSPNRTLTNDILPHHSRLIFAAALRATTPKLGSLWLHRAAAGTNFVYQSSRYADPAGLGVIPAQSSLDLDATLAAFGGRAVLRARVADLFDTERFDVVGFPLPGRSAFFSLELRTDPGLER